MWRCIFAWVLYSGIPVVCLLAWWRWFFYKRPLYRSPLVGLLLKKTTYRSNSAWWIRWVNYIARGVALLALLVALARPQSVDENSRLHIDGIDMMLALDVSDSMNLYDDPQDERTRKIVAGNELIKFIQRRPNDPMGLVLFGASAFARCPRTLDKQLLVNVVKEAMNNFVVNPHGTVLCTALSLAARRLSSSSASSKIIILVTDGAPTQGDIMPHYAIDLLVNLGIKVYVIGIGSSGGYVKTVFGFMQEQSPLNEELLSEIAERTGGKFFQSHKPADLESIYAHIDTLEKSSHDMPLYAHYTEWLMLLLIISAAALFFEMFISCLWTIL
jgi:Ca-activated chloride channel family protein